MAAINKSINNQKRDHERPLTNLVRVTHQQKASQGNPTKDERQNQAKVTAPETINQKIEEEEDEFDRAEKFAKTELYQERCKLFQEALFSIDLSLNSFVNFNSVPAAEEESKVKDFIDITMSANDIKHE
jgi:hypothetical protein